MKKIALLIILAYAGHKIHAQGHTIELKGGLTFSNIDVEVEDQLDNRTGYHIGVQLGFPISDDISFNSGLFLTTKGSKFNEGEFEDDGSNIMMSDYTVRIISHYIDVPVLLSFKLADKLYFHGGPQASILLDNKWKSEYTVCFDGECLTEKMKHSSTEDLTDLDIAIVMGLRYELPSGFNLSGCYDYGIVSIATDTSDNVFNRVFKVSIGYRLK